MPYNQPCQWVRTAEVMPDVRGVKADDELAWTCTEGAFDAVWAPAPHDNPRRLCEEVTRWKNRGVRVMPYITFTQHQDNCGQKPYNDWSFEDHPDWVVIDEQGKYEGSSFAAYPHQVRAAHEQGRVMESLATDLRILKYDLPNRFATCVNNAEFVDHMVKVVKMLVAAGADGFFVDNVHGQPACHGPRHGKHQHIYGDDLIDSLGDEWKLPVEYQGRPFLPADLKYAQAGYYGPDAWLANYAFGQMMERICRELAPLGDQCLFFNISLDICPTALWDYPDLIMYECYLRGQPASVSQGTEQAGGLSNMEPITPGLPRHQVSSGKWLMPWLPLDNSWQDVYATGRMPLVQKLHQRGGRIFCFSGSSLARRDGYDQAVIRWHEFLEYATARLSNSLWSANPATRELTYMRLGNTIDSDDHETDGIYWRRYENGFVAVNPDSRKPAATTIELPGGRLHIYDCLHKTDLWGWGGRAGISLQPQSGNVYLYLP